MLADELVYVIGVDTHRDQHALAVVVASSGAVVAQAVVAAAGRGYADAQRFADRHAGGARVWAVEGAGHYGAALTRFLAARGERVLEVGRQPRGERRLRGKDDPPPPQPRRRPPTQPRPPHRHPPPPPARRRDQGLHRPPPRRRKEHTRRHPHPQALPRPPPLPRHAESHATDDLTVIGDSLRRESHETTARNRWPSDARETERNQRNTAPSSRGAGLSPRARTSRSRVFRRGSCSAREAFPLGESQPSRSLRSKRGCQQPPQPPPALAQARAAPRAHQAVTHSRRHRDHAPRERPRPRGSRLPHRRRTADSAAQAADRQKHPRSRTARPLHSTTAGPPAQRLPAASAG